MRDVVGVIGIGRVGLPLALELSNKFQVLAFEKNADLLATLSQHNMPFHEPGYDDDLDGQGGPVVAPIDPKAYTPAQWQRRLQHLAQTGEWQPIWGPAPGKPGCLVPSHLVLSPVAQVGGAA